MHVCPPLLLCVGGLDGLCTCVCVCDKHLLPLWFITIFLWDQTNIWAPQSQPLILG